MKEIKGEHIGDDPLNVTIPTIPVVDQEYSADLTRLVKIVKGADGSSGSIGDEICSFLSGSLE